MEITLLSQKGSLLRNCHKKLREKRGDMYIEVIIKILVVLMALLLIVSTFSVVMYSQKLNSSADEIRRMVEVDGKFDTTENQKATVAASDGSNWYRQVAQSGPSSTVTDSDTYSRFSSGGQTWYQKTGESTTVRHGSNPNRHTPPSKIR